MANPLLGEVEVKILDRTFTLRPTFGGMIEMEQRAGCTLPVMLRKFVSAQISINDIAAIVWGGACGAPDKNKDVPNYEELGQMIMAHGFLKLSGPCGQVVAAAVSGKPISDIVEKTIDGSGKKKNLKNAAEEAQKPAN